MRIGVAMGLAALVLVRTAGTAYPKDLIEGPLARAKAAIAAKDLAGAAAAIGGGLASVKSLEDEQTLANVFDEWMDTLEPDASASPDANPKERSADVRKALAGVMKPLDPARSGAFVSAHALATELLVDAVASGDTTHMAAAAAVLAAHAKAPKPGKAAAVLAQWGEGMRLASVKDGERADVALEAAAKAAAANGWFTVAAFAATELAALRWKVKAMTNVSNALSIPVAMLGEKSDVVAVQAWMRAVAKRLEGAPTEALGEYAKATARFEHAPSEAGSAADGDNGASGDGKDQSDVGRYLATPGKEKAMVVVARGAAGFTVRLAFRKGEAAVVPFATGQRPWTDGGVVVALADRAAGLWRVDPTGLKGKPGSRLRPSRVRAFYLLADGETLTVSKAGAVTVSP